MKDSKIIAKQLLTDLGSDVLSDGKSVAEDIRVMAEESESFENAVFEVGVMKIAKIAQNFAVWVGTRQIKQQYV